MARKSRKAVIQAALDGKPLPEESKASQPVVWNAGGYVRLSVMETRDRKDSQALSNQMELLRGFIAQKPDLRLCGLYADEGISGTSTKKRDSFNRMITDAKAGRFDFIITKEISRFFRSTLDSVYIRELRGQPDTAGHRPRAGGWRILGNRASAQNPGEAVEMGRTYAENLLVGRGLLQCS